MRMKRSSSESAPATRSARARRWRCTSSCRSVRSRRTSTPWCGRDDRLGRVKTLLALLLLVASSTTCFAESKYTVVRVDDPQQLQLFLRDDSGTPFHRFEKLNTWLQARKQHLRFAMNAGMFEPDYSPVGLFITRAQELAPLNLRAGRGNFYTKPNGVFLVTRAGPRIVESSK